MKELTSTNVESVFFDCLFQDEEDKSGAIFVEGIRTKFGFNPKRLNANAPEIGEMLSQLPDQFHKGKGGGWSFLNACTRQDGQLWTGVHAVVEQLMCMGMAIGKVGYLMPRDMWDVLPGNMPYFFVSELEIPEPVNNQP